MPGTSQFYLGRDAFTLDTVRDLLRNRLHFELHPSTEEVLKRRRDELMNRVARGEVIYGVNTGFGRLKDIRIKGQELTQLQVNLIQSHACGTGPPLEPDLVRLAMVLRAHTLAQGYSGVRPLIIRQIIQYIEKDIIPWVPEQGSVGASGDLAPLAHIAQALIGEGYCFEDGQRVPTREVLKRNNLKPLDLGAREGIALINGTQVSTAILAITLLDAYRVVAHAMASYAMTLDALMGSLHPTDPPVYELRPYTGMKLACEWVRTWLKDSEILRSHEQCDRIQDAYSLRCAPQVFGSVLEGLHFVTRIVATEMNSVTDNPMVLDEGQVLHNGNFHGAPIAMAADLLGIIMSTLASMAERRIFRLTSHEISGLPPFLAPHAGTNSGYMILHVTTASLVSENKTLAHPASVDSIPTSDNQEDHVSMSTWAARKARKIVENAERVILAELLTAAQALEFRRPLKSGTHLEALHAWIRKFIPFRERDYPFHEDLETLMEMMRSDEAESLFAERQLDGMSLYHRMATV